MAHNPRPTRKTMPSSLKMIKAAIKFLHTPGPGNRKGVSVQAIKSFIADQYRAGMDVYGKLINRALKKAVVSGDLRQTTGRTGGAVGSFKLPLKKPSRPKKSPKKSSNPSSKVPRKKAIPARALRKKAPQ